MNASLNRLRFLVLFCIFGNAASSTQLRVVTWNVGDNQNMKNGFTDSAIDKVLSLKKHSDDIYAIGLQENCWNCDKQNLHKVAKKFLDRVNHYNSNNYVVVGVEATRLSNLCEEGCWLNTHGTTVLIILAKKNLIRTTQKFQHTSDCSDRFFSNEEKGVAAIKTKLSNGKSVCFATLHLDSSNPSTRRECLKLFFKDAKKKWDNSCDYEFLFGDFNARTSAKKSGDKPGKFVNKISSDAFKIKDEFKGSNPFGTSSEWKNKNMLSYINSVQSNVFNEGAVSFIPTYSIRPRSECNGNIECYRGNRPVSWTDRIVYTRGELSKYDAILENYSDHFPVYAQFKL